VDSCQRLVPCKSGQEGCRCLCKRDSEKNGEGRVTAKRPFFKINPRYAHGLPVQSVGMKFGTGLISATEVGRGLSVTEIFDSHKGWSARAIFKNSAAAVLTLSKRGSSIAAVLRHPRRHSTIRRSGRIYFLASGSSSIPTGRPARRSRSLRHRYQRFRAWRNRRRRFQALPARLRYQ
jgi:hypothetical protein